MAKDNQDLKKQLANRAPKTSGASAPVVFEQNIKDWFARNGKRMTTLAGTKEEANRFVVTLLHIAGTNPALLSCSMDSLGECLLHSAALNLYPGPMQQCAYVPFKGKAQFIPMYQGIITLAYNSGHVRSINTGVVKEGDMFQYEKGSDPFLKHIEGEDRGELTHAWAVIKMQQGDPIIEVMARHGRDSLDNIMNRSAGVRSGRQTPWDTDLEEMCRKTVVKRALKGIPKSVNLASAIALDNAVEQPGMQRASVVTLDASKVIDDQPKGESVAASNPQRSAEPLGS